MMPLCREDARVGGEGHISGVVKRDSVWTWWARPWAKGGVRALA